MAKQDEDVRDGQRIAKVMARAGLCSRRDAEAWIAEGRVSVNGEVLTSPAFNVSESDDVRVDGEPLRAPERTRLFAFHKPRGLVTTAKDPEGRATIFEALPSDLPRVVAVGRLDINTEGLILLTNDGGLARVLELPATGWLRRYRVRAHGEITQEQLDGLRDGVTIDGVDYLGIEAKFERQQGSNVWLTMGLREGKNREIKRVLEHMGLSVNRLIRVSFGPFELGDLPEGELYEVRTKVLRDQLGPKLSKQAGANFDAPVDAPAPSPEPPRDDLPPRRPREETPKRGDEPRKRKHVSVLRAEAREEGAGPRKRITRATTADRKGREVKVERVSLASPPPPPPPRAARGEGRPRRAASEGFAPRDRDARPSRPREGFTPRDRDARPSRSPRDDARPARAPREGFTPRDRDARPSRPPRDDARPARAPREGFTPRDRDARPSRPPRDDARPARAPREGFTPRDRDARPSRPPRDDARSSRAPREGFTPRDRDTRPSRPPRDDARPARAPREGFTPRDRDARPSRPPRDDARPARAPREGFTPRDRDARPSRPPRDDSRPARAPREGFTPRDRDARPSRPPRDDARPARAPREGFTPRDRDARPSRPPRDDARPARAPREGFAPRAEGARPSRAGKPFAPRSGGRPPAGKGPGGKGGGRPQRPR